MCILNSEQDVVLPLLHSTIILYRSVTTPRLLLLTQTAELTRRRTLLSLAHARNAKHA